MKICEERKILTQPKSKCDFKQALSLQKTRKNKRFSTNTHKFTASKIKKYQFITSLFEENKSLQFLTTVEFSTPKDHFLQMNCTG